MKHRLIPECSYAGGKWRYIVDSAAQKNKEEMGTGINVIKSFLKRFPKLYEFLQFFFSPGNSPIPHITPARAIKKLFAGADLSRTLIVNIGSGVRRVHEEVLNVDIYPYASTDVVADAVHLPFKDNSVDMVICESVLEHISQPFEVIDEIKRVLAPGGYAYVSVPFLYPFHASPDDFIRMSRNALRDRFLPLTVVEEGLCSGPGAALQGVLMHIIGILLSFGQYGLYLIVTNVAMVLLSPLKLLDLFFALFPYSHEIAANIYIVVRK